MVDSIDPCSKMSCLIAFVQMQLVYPSLFTFLIFLQIVWTSTTCRNFLLAGLFLKYPWRFPELIRNFTKFTKDGLAGERGDREADQRLRHWHSSDSFHCKWTEWKTSVFESRPDCHLYSRQNSSGELILLTLTNTCLTKLCLAVSTHSCMLTVQCVLSAFLIVTLDPHTHWPRFTWFQYIWTEADLVETNFQEPLCWLINRIKMCCTILYSNRLILLYCTYCFWGAYLHNETTLHLSAWICS